jgi:hypothetical protein
MGSSELLVVVLGLRVSWGERLSVRRERVLLNFLIFQEGCRRLMAGVVGGEAKRGTARLSQVIVIAESDWGAWIAVPHLVPKMMGYSLSRRCGPIPLKIA